MTFIYNKVFVKITPYARITSSVTHTAHTLNYCY